MLDLQNLLILHNWNFTPFNPSITSFFSNYTSQPPASSAFPKYLLPPSLQNSETTRDFLGSLSLCPWGRPSFHDEWRKLGYNSYFSLLSKIPDLCNLLFDIWMSKHICHKIKYIFHDCSVYNIHIPYTYSSFITVYHYSRRLVLLMPSCSEVEDWVHFYHVKRCLVLCHSEIT